MKTLRSMFIGALFLALASTATAANRAFVSGNGVDTGTCLITAPCRSFAYAITQISSGGEIIAVDTAGYGAVNITQAATIIAAPGVTAFSTASSGFVINVAAGISDTVTLHGITVTGNGLTDGVAFNSGHLLNIENCIINQHSEGIVFSRNSEFGGPGLQMINTIVRNSSIGVDVSNAGGGVAGVIRLRPEIVMINPLIYATVKDCAFLSNNGTGLVARDNSRVTITDTVFSANNTVGVLAVGSDNATSIVSLERDTFSGNGTGVIAGDNSAGVMQHGVVTFANCTITGNITGVSLTPTGYLYSRISNSVLTNTIFGNVSDGSIPQSFSAQ